MKKRRTIFAALIALLVLTMGVNFNAEAQLGGLLNKAKDKMGGGGNPKKLAAELDALIEKSKASIPQPGQTPNATFNWDGEAVATWDGAKNELTIRTDKGGNKSGTVLKVDPSTGKVTDASGKAMGSLSATTVESPNFGTLTLQERTRTYTLKVVSWNKTEEVNKLGGYKVVAQSNGQQIGYYDLPIGTEPNGQPNVLPCAYRATYSSSVSFKFATHNCVISDKEVGAALSIYIASLMLTQEESNKEDEIKKLGYDPSKTYTSQELDDLIRWKDDATEAEIKKIETGKTYSDDRVRGAKVAAVGLKGEWERFVYTNNSGHWNEYSYNVDRIGYWVVYECKDGKNYVAFYTLSKNEGNHGLTERGTCIGFHEVTDWQRK
ncbi:MAG: hypothetical protein J6T60_16590 [Bacteroidales bacterium]|nr:hypothetical protein [Bacteroidales bacterium]